MQTTIKRGWSGKVTKPDSLRLDQLLVVEVFPDPWDASKEVAVLWEMNEHNHGTITHFDLVNEEGEPVGSAQFGAFVARDLPEVLEAMEKGSTKRYESVMAYYLNRAHDAQRIVEEALGKPVEFDRHGHFRVS